MNIKDLFKTINIEEAVENVKFASGTFTKLYNDVMDGVIIPLTNNAGDIIGISYDAKATNIVEDNIASMKFEREYACKPVMEWVLKALEIKYSARKVSSIVEVFDKITITYDDGEVEVLGETETYDEDDYYDEEYLPINLEFDADDEIYYMTDSEIYRFLRDTYGYYLSGNEPKPEILRDDDKIYINNISWGRKTYKK